MLKFEKFLRKYLTEDVYFYRNDNDTGEVIDKHTAKYIYYSEENNNKTRYFVKQGKNGNPREINYIDYCVARDGIKLFIKKHPEQSETKKIQDILKNYLEKEKYYNLSNKGNSSFHKIDEIVDDCNDRIKFISKLFNEIENLQKEIPNLTSEKDTLDFFDKIYDNAKRNKYNAEISHSKLLKLYKKCNKNSNKQDEIKKVNKKLESFYIDIENLSEAIKKEYNDLVNITNKIKNKNEEKRKQQEEFDKIIPNVDLYNYKRDGSIDFQSIKVSNSKEGEELVKKKCGLDVVKLAGLKGKSLNETVTALIKMHELYPEVFDKNKGVFKKFYTEEGLIEEAEEKINEKYKKYNYIHSFTLDAGLVYYNMPLYNILHNIYKIAYGDYNDIDKDSDEYKELVIKEGLLFLLLTFNKSEKYKNIDKKYDEENLTYISFGMMDDDGKLLPEFNIKSIKNMINNDFIKIIREKDKKYFNGKFFNNKTDKEILQDMNEYIYILNYLPHIKII